MRFDNPELLYLLFIFVILIPLIIVRYRKNRNGVALFAAAAPSHERRPLLRELRLRMLLSDVFFLLFVGFVVVALAGPSWGMRLVADHRRGVDVILAFDLSRSMDVLDSRHHSRDNVSRLELGREIAQDFVTYSGELRIGVAIGKGRGVLALPLTYDTEIISAFLYSLNTRIISGGGTNLESLVDAAAAAFDDSIPSRRRIIVFSDGEGLTGSFKRAVDRARRAGIGVSAVGLGSELGGPVPVEPGPNAPDGFLVGPDGRVIISVREEDVLRNGAERSGGFYVDGNRSDAARVLAGYINSLSAESMLAGNRREPNPRWQIFLLAAMTCLALSRLMAFGRRDTPEKSRVSGKQGRLGKSGAVLAVLLCLFLFSSCSGARSKLLILEGNFFKNRGYYTEAISSYLRALAYDDVVPYAEYGLGSAFFALDEDLAALERYKNAETRLLYNRADYSGHSELRYRTHYNMGIIYFEQGEYTEAAQAFREALIIDGSRIEAKRNLELSLLTIARSSSPQAYIPQDREEVVMEGQSSSSSVIFEYLREREQERWRNMEWDGEGESSGLDY